MQKLYASLKSDISQEGLTLAGAWVIGEYGDSLLRGGQYEEEELVQEVHESDIVDLFSTTLTSSYATQITSEYIITALMKLTTRLTDPAQVERVRRLLHSHSASLDVEIQQRAVEYGNLFGYDQIRRGVLEKMPAPEIREEQRVLGEAMPKRKSTIAKSKKGPKQSEQDMLLDLMGGSGMPSADLGGAANGSQNNADLLADILGGDNKTSAPSQANASSMLGQPRQTTTNSVMDLFDSNPSNTNKHPSTSTSSADMLGGLSSMTAQPSSSSVAGPPHQPAYNKNDLVITLQLQRNVEGIVQIVARFRNSGNFNKIAGITLQAAVPKTQKLQLNAISSNELDGGEEATQTMRVMGSKSVSVQPEGSIMLLIIYSRRCVCA